MKAAKKSLVNGLLFACSLLLSSLAVAVEPVAMITDFKGGGTVVKQGKSVPITLLSYLPAGEELTLEAGSQLVVTYFEESAEFSFKGPARIVIQPKLAKVLKGAPAGMRQLDKEKSTGAAKFARTGKLAFATVEMRALAIKPTLLSPVNTKISGSSPLFQWKSVNEAEGYLFVLNDEAGSPLQQVNVTGTTWQLPADVVLKPSVTYQWSVVETLKSGEKVTARGNFSIADEASVARVASKRPDGSASFSDKLTYAIFLESEGFREDAKTLWRELAALRPDDPNLKFRAR